VNKKIGENEVVDFPSGNLNFRSQVLEVSLPKAEHTPAGFILAFGSCNYFVHANGGYFLDKEGFKAPLKMMVEAETDAKIVNLIMENCTEKEALRNTSIYLNNVKTIQKAIHSKEKKMVPSVDVDDKVEVLKKRVGELEDTLFQVVRSFEERLAEIRKEHEMTLANLEEKIEKKLDEKIEKKMDKFFYQMREPRVLQPQNQEVSHFLKRNWDQSFEANAQIPSIHQESKENPIENYSGQKKFMLNTNVGAPSFTTKKQSNKYYL